MNTTHKHLQYCLTITYKSAHTIFTISDLNSFHFPPKTFFLREFTQMKNLFIILVLMWNGDGVGVILCKPVRDKAERDL